MVPLAAGLEASGLEGRVVFIGNLDGDEHRELSHWRRRLEALGWRLEIEAPVARAKVLESIASASGHLLLSSSVSSLPAKLFDYLPARRPILAVAPEGSAVWEVGAQLPQMSRVAIGDDRAGRTVADFIDHCRTREIDAEIPERFEERRLQPLFMEAVRAAVRSGSAGSPPR
jgi:hypothetical protein